MKIRISIIAALINTLAIQANAQTDADALRYSQSSITGTARYTSMAGAFGALGGDFSAIATNPAGLGIYRSSEFTFSPSLYLNQTTSDFLGTQSTESRTNFNIPNFGFVFGKSHEGSSCWKSWGLGIGLNRINSFQANTYYEGYNPKTSMLDYFAQNANDPGNGGDATNFNPFYEGLAYDAGLIYYDSTAGQYISDLKAGQGINQYRTGTTRGAMNEWNFDFGASYNNLLYLGAGFGLRTIHYEDESIYEEKDKDNVIDVLNSFTFQQDLVTNGTGWNFKLGAIVRPADAVRLGLSFHTPTVYSMHDDYVNSMTSNLTGYDFGLQTSPYGHYNYKLTTPSEVTASLGFIFGKSGLLGIDYQFVDYASARLSASDYSFSDVNNLIRQKYTTAGNLRVGGEYRWQDLSFRGGYALYGSPISAAEKISGSDYSKTSYSGGIGLRDKNLFVDLAYIYTVSHEYFQPYTLSYTDVDGVRNKVNTHNVVLTFGVKF